MSTLRILCSSCGAKLTAPATAMGKQVKCPKCGMKAMLTARLVAPAAVPAEQCDWRTALPPIQAPPTAPRSPEPNQPDPAYSRWTEKPPTADGASDAGIDLSEWATFTETLPTQPAPQSSSRIRCRKCGTVSQAPPSGSRNAIRCWSCGTVGVVSDYEIFEPPAPPPETPAFPLFGCLMAFIIMVSVIAIIVAIGIDAEQDKANSIGQWFMGKTLWQFNSEYKSWAGEGRFLMLTLAAIGIVLLLTLIGVVARNQRQRP